MVRSRERVARELNFVRMAARHVALRAHGNTNNDLHM